VTRAGEILRDEIARSGPVRFDRFMEVALYHPECGYYRTARDPFGREGDFYTAAQLQPVFGLLVRRMVEEFLAEDRRLIELGPGRGEMEPYFAGLDYTAVRQAPDDLPAQVSGVVFSNELFDALPVRVLARDDAGWREMRVRERGGQFLWTTEESVSDEAAAWAERWAGPETERLEVCLTAARLLDELALRSRQTTLITMDYGVTARELVRFPQGTLMAYRRHQALDDVLQDPGERDITAHVNFTLLQEHGARAGWRTVRFESLAQSLLRAGERDAFAEVLGEEEKRRLQLKTLLFGMGETFRVLVQEK
jgi:SAM-dependent MidA family methyltransferase